MELNPLGFKTMQGGDFMQGQQLSEKTEVMLEQKTHEVKTSEFTEQDRKPYAEIDSTIVNSRLESSRQSPIKSLGNTVSRNTNYGGKLPPLTQDVKKMVRTN